jgi:hypothetical protein
MTLDKILHPIPNIIKEQVHVCTSRIQESFPKSNTRVLALETGENEYYEAYISLLVRKLLISIKKVHKRGEGLMARTSSRVPQVTASSPRGVPFKRESFHLSVKKIEKTLVETYCQWFVWPTESLSREDNSRFEVLELFQNSISTSSEYHIIARKEGERREGERETH